MPKRLLVFLASVTVVGSVALPALAGTPRPLMATETLVSVGSPATPFAQNKQNEPGVAIDAHDPSVVAAGANDEIDVEACAAGDPTSCPFTPGVGTSGVYFSLDGGRSWTQPTYTGYSARGCLGPAACTPDPNGPIGTLPWYFEKNLVSDGDPSLAFGPRPDAGGNFSWDNGSRLYFSNIESAFPGSSPDESLKGFEGIGVSRTDDPRAAAASDKGAWMLPVLASRQSSTTFSDHPEIWADNATSSRFFGNVYVCYAQFRSQQAAGPEPIVVVRSTDGGDTWSKPVQLTQAANNNTGNGRQDCYVRTDSHGTVDVVWDGGFDHQDAILMSRSFDGGKSFERPRVVSFYTPAGAVDPVSGDVTFDGIAGNRDGTFPTLSIANGAPTGSGATDEIVIDWTNGPTPTDQSPGPNEDLVIAYSTDGGSSFSSTADAAPDTDRPDYPGLALSPNGQDLYVGYDAFLTPWRTTTASPRPMQGVVRHAVIGPGGTPTGWTDLFRGPTGDARAGSANALSGEFLGDYNTTAAMNDFAVATYIDVRNASDCPAVDAYRQSLATDTPLPKPAPAADCPAAFGNTDIFGGRFSP
jgi:hypothetical protein